MFHELQRLLGVPDYLDHINNRLRRLERKMSRLTESSDAIVAFVGSVKTVIADQRTEIDRLKAENAEAIADDAQDTAQIEELIASQEAVADKLEQALAEAGEDTEPEPDTSDDQAPAEEPTA